MKNNYRIIWEEFRGGVDMLGDLKATMITERTWCQSTGQDVVTVVGACYQTEAQKFPSNSQNPQSLSGGPFLGASKDLNDSGSIPSRSLPF